MALLVEQDAREFAAYIALLKENNVKRYLEVGSHHGGTVTLIAALLDLTRVVSVDLGLDDSRKTLEDRFRVMVSQGTDAHVILGDSTEPKVIKQAKELGPYDCVMIDGDHSLAGVKADWNNYKDMAPIVAFHDISWKRQPEWVGRRIEVPEFWDTLKTQYRHAEFIRDVKKKNNGIGVLFR